MESESKCLKTNPNIKERADLMSRRLKYKQDSLVSYLKFYFYYISTNINNFV